MSEAQGEGHTLGAPIECTARSFHGPPGICYLGLIMPVAPSGLRWLEDVDIGIVGAGGCGLVAAHAAARADLKVVVWEGSKSPGGTTGLSNGLVAAAGTRMQRDAGIVETSEDLVRDILARNGGRSDPLLTQCLCDSSAALVEWLTDTRGVAFELVKQVHDPGHKQLRLHAPPARSGQALINALLRSAERRGIRLHLGTPVLQLWTDADGAVVGVQVKTAKKSPINVRCGKVIVATGGFGANPELVKEHCPAAAGLNFIGAQTSTGDALAWAADLGAATQDLSAYDAHATVTVGSNQLVPWTLILNGAILVNQAGERFADETRGPGALVALMLSQPGRVTYEIFDARILKLATAEDVHFAADVVPRAVRRSEDIGGLAKQFQIDPEALERTVATHNAGTPLPLSPPFYGIRVGVALLQTLGGLSIDPSARVLRTDGTPVTNLYAGGGAAVAVSGPGADGYLLGEGLLCALGWGKIAGEHAARELLSARASQEAPPALEGEPGQSDE
jgi:fumarate reductase flavoprotein subunit